MDKVQKDACQWVTVSPGWCPLHSVTAQNAIAYILTIMENSVVLHSKSGEYFKAYYLVHIMEMDKTAQFTSL
jgi:hypothetical protein